MPLPARQPVFRPAGPAPGHPAGPVLPAVLTRPRDHPPMISGDPPKEPPSDDPATGGRDKASKTLRLWGTQSPYLAPPPAGPRVGDSEQIVHMRVYQQDLRGKLETLTAQTAALQQDLERTRQENRWSLRGADHRLAEFADQTRRELQTCQKELDTCRDKISELEHSVKDYAAIDVQLREELQTLRQENDLLRRTAAEERAMFMRLVSHAANGKAVAFLSRRLERGEEIVGELTAANKTLTDMHLDATMAVDRVTQERDFLHASLSASERENTQLVEANKTLTETKANLTAEVQRLNAEVDRLTHERDFLRLPPRFSQYDLPAGPYAELYSRPPA